VTLQQQQQQPTALPTALPTQPVTVVHDGENRNGQQGSMAAAATGTEAVVAALQALQLSLEGRLDTMLASLDRMEKRLSALEQGPDFVSPNQHL
jgi:hypothetical protein